MDTGTSSETSYLYSQTVVPVFTGKKYLYWFMRMKILFRSEGLWDIVENGPQALDPEKASETTPAQFSREVRRKDAQALFLIHQGVSETIFPRIMGADTAKQAWETLKEVFRGSEKVLKTRLLAVWRKFSLLRMKEGETVDDFFSRTIDIVNHIKFFGDQIEDKEIVLKVLGSLPPSFELVVVAIEVRKDLSTLTVPELMWSLKFHEELLKSRADEVPAKAYQLSKPAVKSRGRGNQSLLPLEKQAPIHEKQTPYCIICKKTDHECKQCYFRCKQCRIPNHSDQDCWYKEEEKLY